MLKVQMPLFRVKDSYVKGKESFGRGEVSYVEGKESDGTRKESFAQGRESESSSKDKKFLLEVNRTFVIM